MGFKSKYMLILLLCFIAACNISNSPEEQKADAIGIFKSSLFNSSDWHHVATIHGWANDLEVCEELIGFLNKQESGRYICQDL